ELDDTERVKRALDFAEDKGVWLVFGAKEYTISENILVNGRIRIKGVARKTKLQFTTTEGWALSFNSQVIMEDMQVFGNKDINGLNLNPTKNPATSVVDGYFKNVRFDTFEQGIEMGYCWCNEFHNVRFHTCRVLGVLSSQSNLIS